MKRTIEQDLLAWREAPHRMPLVMRGARQVGKSFTIEQFGKEHFDNVVVANFEFQPDLGACFDSLDPAKIIAKLELLTNANIAAGKTLLFLDEIQECPNALRALRYFKEKMPELHVIGAGSLLEFLLHEHEFSFPVGRMQFIYMHPLSFREFLWALGEKNLVHALEQVTLAEPFDDVVHIRLMNFIRHYFLLGGMPAVVRAYSENRSFVDAQKMQAMLLQTYRNDFGKYASRAQHKYLQKLFMAAPGLVAQNFKYAKVDADMRSRDLKTALMQLQWAGLIHVVQRTSASGLPMAAQLKEDKMKILFLDIGLLQNSTYVDAQMVLSGDVLQINAGALAEQFVGQEILASTDSYQEGQLYFWEREKKGSAAEVDYVINVGAKILPVEVKAGKTGRLRSLQQFIEEKESALGVRISSQPLERNGKILSIPLYLTDQIARLVGMSIERST